MKHQVQSSDIGKTITYIGKNKKQYQQRVVGINEEKNYFIVIGDFPLDVPMRIFPRFVKSIN